MNGSGLHSALRQLQAHFSDPRVLGSMGLIAVMLGLAGPFGTYQFLGTLPRLVYWLAVVVATYGLGSAIGMAGGEWVRARVGSPVMRPVVYGLLIGPPVTVAVGVVNAITFGGNGLQAIGWLELLLYCVVVAIGVSAVSEIIGAAVRKPQVVVVESPSPAPPPILERLPLPQRGQLLALSVSDHYVEVATDRGKGLLLMRLADAMRETGGVAGVQIHRSHWVALAAVGRVFRSDGKPMVELSDGTQLPISRGFLPAARQAGLVV